MQTVSLYSSAYGDYSLQVVGEESYQDEIKRVVAYDGDNKKNFREDGLTAELILDDKNPYDKGNAVRIEIDRQTVGYLSRSDARKYREGLSKQGLKNVIGTCYAAIFGKYNDEKEGLLFGVYLDLDVDKLVIISATTPVKRQAKQTKPAANQKKSNQWKQQQKYRKKEIALFNTPIQQVVFSGIQR